MFPVRRIPILSTESSTDYLSLIQKDNKDADPKNGNVKAGVSTPVESIR